MTSENIITALRACGMRCKISGVLVSIENKNARKVHLDRIVNSIGHIMTNVEVKIHLFSGPDKLTRKMFLLVFLNQTLVELSNEVRAKAQADYDKL